MMNNSQAHTKRTKLSEFKQSRFYQIPKWLIHEQQFKRMSGEAMILYAIMKDRQELSIKNNWVNSDGEVYIKYSRKEMMIDLNMSDKTITKCMNELKKYGLVEEERQGLNKANLIFLCTIDYDSQWNRKNYDSGTVKITIQEPKELRQNDTNIIKTNISDTNNNKDKVFNTTVHEKKVIHSYVYYFKRKPTKSILDQLDKYSKCMDDELIEKSFAIAFLKNKTWCYSRGILKKWKQAGIKNISDYLQSK